MTGNQGGNYEAILWTRTGNGCGTVIGAAAISGLHAQARPPGFLVTEIDVTNPEGLRQRVRPQGNIKAAGGRFVALGRDWGGWSEAGDCPFRHAAKAGYHYSLGQFRSTECLVQQCGVPSSAQDRRTVRDVPQLRRRRSIKIACRYFAP